jgi:uncharacterized membrane protein YdbT with pleckstrin-like domain
MMDDGRVALPALLAQLAEDAKASAQAEIRLAKAKATAKFAAVKSGAILFAVAAMLALLGLIGLVVGCVMALATLIGPGFAGLVVFLVLLVLAGLFAWAGIRQLSTTPQAVTEKAA